MQIAHCLFDIETVLSLVNETLFPQVLEHRTQLEPLPILHTATKQPLNIEVKILLHVRFGSLSVRVRFGADLGLAVNILLDAFFC